MAVTTQPAGLAVSVTYDGAVEPPAAAGSYAVVAVISDPGYSGSAYSTLVIAPKATSVSPTPAGKTYGDADPTLDGTLAGFVPADGVTAAYSRTPGENVGEYVISATLHPEAALANYDITCNTATFTIGPRKITVTADAQAKFVGDADPELTYQLTGGSLIGMDPLTGSLSRAPGEDAGTYPITQGTLTAGSNYALTYIGAALTIRLNDTSTELSASTLAARLDEPVTFTAVVSAGGEPVSGGTVTFRDGEMTLGASVLAGGQAQLTLSTLGLGEHAITAVYGGDGGWAGSTSDPVIVTVAKKAATVTIGGLEQTYDGQPKPVTVTTSPAGLTVAITYAGSAAAPVAAGEYVVSAAILSASYEGSTSGILLISPRPASVAAHEKTKVYGAANPALTATVEGVVAGDTIAHSLATTAEALSGVGDYRIIVSLGDNPNYDVTPLDGVLSITPKAATVTAHDTSKVYGEEVPPLTAAVEGQVEGGASIVYLLSTTAEKTSDVGDYDITVKLGANPNYTVTATGATLHINKGQSTVSLTARAATVLLDKPVIFDATAAAVAPASGTPTGWLDFYEGETLLMTKVALVGGVAELKLSNLSSGPHAIQAKYSGDDNWLGDGSEVVSVFIANPGFTMSLACAASEPVPQEGPALFKATFANTGNIELLITAGGGIGSFALAPGASTGFTVSLPGDYSGQSAVEASVGASSVYIDDAGNRWSGETSGTAACAVACRVSLLKWTNGAVDPTKGWIFSVWDGADGFGGTRLATATTLDNADGLLDFGNLALDSGKAYTLCEENIPAGWTFFWQVDTDDDGAVDTALIPYNPNADDLDPDTGEPAPGDEGNRCVDFGAVTGVDLMTTGGTLHFLVNDTYPGGEPRPADYWKNWNRCTDDGQAATADANGGWQEGYWLLEDVLDPAIGGGITWDDILADSVLFPITRCAVAVDLLDQRSLGDPAVVYDGIKHAEDAAYGLAKELLAAQLNLGAAARTCTEATDAVLNGEKLLDKYNFVAGDGAAYLVATNKKTKADYNLALSLAATLAEYNNGLLCTGVEPPVVTITSPAGPTVSGDSVTVVAGVISAAGVVQVAFLVDGVLIGTDTDAADGWSMAWSLVGVADKAYTLTVTATDTLDQAGSATINVTVDNEADPTIKVAVLTPDSRWTKVGVTWEATIAVQVEPALAGAVVSGSWSTGVTASCTTAADGTCTVVLPNISKKVASVTFTVSNVALSGYVYDPSGATAVTVTKP